MDFVSATAIEVALARRCTGEQAIELLKRLLERHKNAGEPETRPHLVNASLDLYRELKRWEQFARDNQWTDEDITWLPATRAAIAKAEGTQL